jgi:hypothetical protein
VELAEHADGRLAEAHRGAAARVVGHRPIGLVADVLDAERAGQPLDHALGVGELVGRDGVVETPGLAAAGEQHAERARLGRQLAVAPRQEHRGQLVDGHAGQAAGEVAPGDLGEADEQGGAQLGLLLGDGIEHPQRVAARVVGRQLEPVQVGLGQERVGTDLGEAHAGQQVARAAAQALLVGEAPPGGLGQGGRQVVVAPAPRHLLLEVGPLLQVEAPARRDRHEAVGLDLDRAADAAQVLGGEVRVGGRAEALGGAAPVEPDRLVLAHARAGLQPPAGDRAAREPGHERRRLVAHGAGAGRVDAAGPALPALGAHAEAAHGPAHAGRGKVRGFQQHAPGGGADLRLLAAHDARQRQRLLAGGDEGVAGLEHPIAAVQGAQHLSGAGAAHDDAPARHQLEVESVQRLALVEQQVVGDVDHRAQRPLAVQVQPPRHPQRRRPGGVQPLDHPGDVHRAAFGVLHLDRGEARGGRAVLWHGEVERLQLGAEHQRGLTGDAAHRQHVAAVGRGFHVQHGVAQADRLDQVDADRSVRWQHQDARVVVEDPQLPGGGEHAVRPDAADLLAAYLEAAGELGAGRRPGHHVARLVVVGAADHLARLAAGLDGDQGEPLGIGVAADVEHPRGQHAADVLAHPVDPLDLDPGEGEPVGQGGGRGPAEIDVVGQPGEWNPHRSPP